MDAKDQLNAPAASARIGMGYDIHRLGPGRGLTLGGVKFPRAGFTLVGHSDADVLVHAACDALLGAAGLPDIGVLFPNTSARHRGRSSLEFLREVGERLRRSGWTPVNLDCTLIAERPRIASRVPAMRRRLAQALRVPSSAIGIKATTNEGIGSIGRGEGMAALAVALLAPASRARTRLR
jgi:2-C-methyl-D-erythritol 2,4-cyclodiphosphate synthase